MGRAPGHSKELHPLLGGHWGATGTAPQPPTGTASAAPPATILTAPHLHFSKLASPTKFNCTMPPSVSEGRVVRDLGKVTEIMLGEHEGGH